MFLELKIKFIILFKRIKYIRNEMYSHLKITF